MKDYIKALKEVENEDEDFKLTLSKKEILDIIKEIERLYKYAVALAKIQDLNNSLLNDKHFREILNEEILEELND